MADPTLSLAISEHMEKARGSLLGIEESWRRRRGSGSCSRSASNRSESESGRRPIAGRRRCHGGGGIRSQRSIELAEQAVIQALETWNRLRIAPPRAGSAHQFDPLQPLIAFRDLADAPSVFELRDRLQQVAVPALLGVGTAAAVVAEMPGATRENTGRACSRAGTEDLPPPARSGR